MLNYAGKQSSLDLPPTFPSLSLCARFVASSPSPPLPTQTDERRRVGLSARASVYGMGKQKEGKV